MNNLYLKTWSGLCNRLRVIASFKEICNQPFNIVWTPDQLCDGKFTDVFEVLNDFPIHETVERKDNMVWVDNGVQQFKANLTRSNITNIIKPNQKVWDRIKEIELPEEYNSIHVRWTDFPKRKRKPFIEFKNFITDSKLPVYVSCDDKKIWEELSNMFGSKLLGHSFFRETNELRSTDLLQAVADLWICADSKNFLGNRGSSFSDFIESLRTETFTLPPNQFSDEEINLLNKYTQQLENLSLIHI